MSKAVRKMPTNDAFFIYLRTKVTLLNQNNSVYVWNYNTNEYILPSWTYPLGQKQPSTQGELSQ